MNEIVLLIYGFLILYFFLLLFSTRNIYMTVLFMAFLVPLTELHNNVFSLIYFYIVIVFLVFKNIFLISKKEIIRYFVYFILLSILIFLSILNGAHLYNIFASIGKIVLILFFLMDIKIAKGWNYFIKLLKLNIKVFVITSVLSIPLLATYGYYELDNLGGVEMYRISGFLFDPNYFALLCLIYFIFVFNYLDKGRYAILILLLAMIILSQSWSTIFLLLTYIVFLRNSSLINKLIIRVNPYLPFIFIIFLLLLFSYLTSSLEIEFFDDWETSNLSFKFNSILVRLDASLRGYLLLQDDPSLYILGLGSGRSLEFADRVFHNSYFQNLFDHGVIFYVVLYGLLFSFLVKRGANTYLVGNMVVFILSVQNLLFDNLYIFLYSYVLFIFYHCKSGVGSVSLDSKNH